MSELVFWLVFVHAAISVVLLSTVGSDGTMERHNAVWWSIALVKYLAKTLCLALFTGWE